MKSSETEIAAILGTAMGGGFYAGRIVIDGVLHALIVAPKAEGEIESVWNSTDKGVDSAKSYFDGAANTVAMAESGAELGRWAKGLTIAGVSDWYIPSQDELEIIYRNLKPTTDENSHYARSGINLSGSPATRPYTATEPCQTLAEAFQEGGAEAFEGEWHWSSTQHAGNSDSAWIQGFDGGTQGYDRKSYEYRARAVRRLAI